MAEPSTSLPSVQTVEQRGTTHLVLGSPILDRGALDEIEACLLRLASGAHRVPLVLRSAHPTVFLAGAHLGEIARLGPADCAAYAARGRRVASLLGQHAGVTVAAVHGSCSGGGFDLAMSCDAIVVGPNASFDHPGVRRGLVTGWTGTTMVRPALGGPTARAVLLEGRSIDAAAAVASGLALSAADDPATGATDLALRLAALDPGRIELWRLLRGPAFVDRFRATVVHK